MVFLDIEGTLLDDLEHRAWLDVSKLNLTDGKFIIYTWGWFNPSEIDWQLIHEIEQKLSARCFGCLVKKPAMDYIRKRNADVWTWNGELDIYAEDSFNLKFTKETSFIELMKIHAATHTQNADGKVIVNIDKENTLIDDTIKDNCDITFPDIGTTIHLRKA